MRSTLASTGEVLPRAYVSTITEAMVAESAVAAATTSRLMMRILAVRVQTLAQTAAGSRAESRGRWYIARRPSRHEQRGDYLPASNAAIHQELRPGVRSLVCSGRDRRGRLGHQCH